METRSRRLHEPHRSRSRRSRRSHRFRRSRQRRRREVAGRRCRCSEFGSYGSAQELLRQGHTNLDSNGNGEACESLRH